MSYSRSVSGLGLSYYDVQILQQRLHDGYAGLGDYASDHAAWLQEKAAYDSALANYNRTMADLTVAYSSANAAYGAAMAEYSKQQAAYKQALLNYQTRQSGLRARNDSMNAAAKKKDPSIVLPAGYPGCVSQAEHDEWVRLCAQLSSVKGLGAAATGPVCSLTALPVCVDLGPAPQPPTMTLPVAPGKPAPPSPPAPLRPEPQAPPPGATLPPRTTTSLVPSPGDPITAAPPTTTASATKSGGLLSNGLILIVLAGGGYALYRTLKKPKPASAAA